MSAALLIAAGISGCAGGSSSPIVVRVGDDSIDRAVVDHWASAIKLGDAVGVALGRSHGTPRAMALSFLISADWLIGEAARRGLEVSVRAIDQALKERVDSTSNGRTEFQEGLSRKGQTIADVKLEIKAMLAAAMLREALSKRFPALTHEDVAAYYSAHRGSFHNPDQRIVDLIEDIPTANAARALGERLGPGARFARRAMRESVLRQTPYDAAHRPNGKLVHAIFRATPGMLAAPVLFNDRWVLLVVRRIVPGSPRPLDDVAEDIARRLLAQRRRMTEPGFLASYRRRWTAKTSCSPGFIVQKCVQYRGQATPEQDPLRTTERGV